MSPRSSRSEEMSREDRSGACQNASSRASLFRASTSDFRNERSSARSARGSASSPEPSPLDRGEPRQPAQAQHERDEEVQPQPEHVVGVVDPQCLLEDPEA